MQFSREIYRILFFSLGALTIVGLSAAFWALAGPQTLLQREDNPRRLEAQAAIQRGSIYDRNGEPLAETLAGADGLARHYHAPSAYSAVGYYSLRYGTAGAEAAFDALLNGSRTIANFEDYFQREILRRPPVGSDIRLQLDAEMQRAIVEALGDARGAAVVMNAQTGQLLALASLPSYDPNSLDDDWSALVEADGNPFFNRALQGNYQLGSAIYALWLAQAIENDFDLTRHFSQAADSLELGDEMNVGCIIEPAENSLTLVEAFIYGCPRPFHSYQQQISNQSFDEMVSPYSFDAPITLEAFPLPEPIALPDAAADGNLDDEALERRRVLGQGGLTTTPLHLAAMTAAISNDGRAPTPQILAATREPEADEWMPAPAEASATTMMSAKAARHLRRVLQESWKTLQTEPVPAAIEMGALLGRSQSGESTQIWLNGFLSAEDATFAFVILLEDSDDRQRLIAIGQALSQSFSRTR